MEADRVAQPTRAHMAGDPTARLDSAEFHRDPLAYLGRRFPAQGEAVWAPGRQLCLGEPAAARSVLDNSSGLYEEHSDFFFTRNGPFGPRSAQERIGRGARDFLRAYLHANADRLPGAVEAALVPHGRWPDAGNRLVYHHLKPALLAAADDSSVAFERRSRRLAEILDAVVERAVLAGARERHSHVGRMLFRFRVNRELCREVKARRGEIFAPRQSWDRPPRDLLDIVVQAGGEDSTPADLGEVYLSLLFAIAGSVGFTLGWSLYLLGTHPTVLEPATPEPATPEPATLDPGPMGNELCSAWVVREALRLWPVAWMLGRQPSRNHEVAGVDVTPEDSVVVCPYLVHRHPEHWADAEDFRPERWASVVDHEAFIPFGTGPHRCTAAALTLRFVEEILDLLLESYDWSFEIDQTRPFVGPALAPPRFGLGLRRKRPQVPEERR